MHLILTGATGMVGSAVLDAMIKSKEVTRISILSRRPVKMAEDAKDPRINVIIHKDFEQYSAELLEGVKDAHGCVWALGISQTQVGKEEYIKITKDYALAAAKAFQKLPSDGDKEPFNFVFVSGQGSTFRPGMLTPIFGRVKGETELALAEMRKANPLFRASTIRPSFIDLAAHDEIKPYLPEQAAYIRILLGPVLRMAVKSSWSPTRPLGDFLTQVATGRLDAQLQGPGVDKIGEFPVVENFAFRRIMGLDK